MEFRGLNHQRLVIYPADKCQNANNSIVGILTFMSKINFVLS